MEPSRKENAPLFLGLLYGCTYPCSMLMLARAGQGAVRRAACVHPLMRREKCFYKVRNSELVHAVPEWLMAEHACSASLLQCQARAGAVEL